MRSTIYFCFVLFFFSCENTNHSAAPELAFYHWKNKINLSSSESEYLEDLSIQKLYLRFFDVDWDATQKEPVPISIVQFSSPNKIPSKIVPTVFITNRTFLKIKNNDILNFAEKLLLKIKRIQKQIPQTQISEIQIDCDWTQKSKKNYFHFLDLLKKKLKKENKQLSVTIRLHQFKYPNQTGIPPADRGALMCYNVGELQIWETENSILDQKTTASYLRSNMNYSLPLDLALPVFHWGVLFRDGEMIKLINQLEASELNDQKFYSFKNKNRYTVQHSTYLHGHYLYPGDQLRLESVSPKVLKTVSQQLKNALPSPSKTLIFYHLDSLTVANYSVNEIKEIQRIFGEVN